MLVNIFAYILDLIFGDPYGFPHPVIFMGKLISLLEKFFRKYFKENLVIAGLLIWILVSGISFFTVYGLVHIIEKTPYIVSLVVSSLLLYTCFSTKCLADEGKKVYRALKACSDDNLENARKQLSYIVGRDTSELERDEIIRATVETIAENTVDGTISPMFYSFLLGVPGEFLFKAVNTMDSMLGYKNEKYINIGKVPAIIDDIFNYIPARFSVLPFTIASMILRCDYKSCLKISIRDRKNHKSPNCAYSEGAVAGALGIQLGGTNVYFGEKIYKPTIGDRKRGLVEEDILMSIRLLYVSTIITLLIFIIINLLIWRFYV